MTESDEKAVGLTPLKAGVEIRAGRVSARVAQRIAAARRAGVVDHLARMALPAVFAAAASITLAAVLPSAREQHPNPTTMVARFMSGDRPLSFAELVAMTEDNR